MAETGVRCLKCGRFAGKKLNFCGHCGNSMKAQGEIAVKVDSAFSDESVSLMNEMDLVDATEIVSVIRRPDDSMSLDWGDTDPDVALGLLLKGIVIGVMAEMEMILENKESDEEEDP